MGRGTCPAPSQEGSLLLPSAQGRRAQAQVGSGCIVNQNLSVLSVAIVKTGETEIPGLTTDPVPRRLGPKRASHLRKLFNLGKQDDVRQYVIKRPLPVKEGKEVKKPTAKAPKIQRLVTPTMLQRKRHRLPSRGDNGRRTVSRLLSTPRSWPSARRRLRKPRSSDARGQHPTGRAGLQSLQLKFTPHFWLT